MLRKGGVILTNSELAVDWGVNGAILFGRQKTRTQHHETLRYNDGGEGYILADQGTPVTVYRHAPAAQMRIRGIVVPNIGSFTAIPFKYSNAKASFGYKAGFFFGAVDGGIDVRNTYDRKFYGPYPTISISLGGSSSITSYLDPLELHGLSSTVLPLPCCLASPRTSALSHGPMDTLAVMT